MTARDEAELREVLALTDAVASTPESGRLGYRSH